MLVDARALGRAQYLWLIKQIKIYHVGEEMGEVKLHCSTVKKFQELQLLISEI